MTVESGEFGVCYRIFGRASDHAGKGERHVDREFE
jgi:hypothetical protein